MAKWDHMYAEYVVLAELTIGLIAALTAVQISGTVLNALFWFWSLQIAAKIRVSCQSCAHKPN